MTDKGRKKEPRVEYEATLKCGFGGNRRRFDAEQAVFGFLQTFIPISARRHGLR